MLPQTPDCTPSADTDLPGSSGAPRDDRPFDPCSWIVRQCRQREAANAAADLRLVRRRRWASRSIVSSPTVEACGDGSIDRGDLGPDRATIDMAVVSDIVASS